jgi:Flp pilus assembly protein protease CpaA
MIEVIVLFSLALVWVLFASVQDIKSQEVANWISISLIIFALGFRFFFCLFTETGTGAGFGFFYQGLIGLAIFFVLGHILYYSKLFAGGDAKLIIALGAILPLSADFWINVTYFLYFLFIFLITGAVYGFIVSFVLVARNFTGFKKEFKKRFRKSKNIIYMNMFFALFLIILGITQVLFLIIGVLFLIMPFLYVYAKAVDESCTVKKIAVGKLREGDWIYKDVRLGKRGKTIKAKWEGLSKKELKLIQKKLKSVKIRQGIPFVPVIFLSLLIFMVFFLVTKAWFLVLFS